MHLFLQLISFFSLSSSSSCTYHNFSASVFCFHLKSSSNVQKRCAILNHINAIPQTSKSAHKPHNTLLITIIKFIWMWNVIFANSWASVNIYIHLRKTNRKSLNAELIRIVCTVCTVYACVHAYFTRVCTLWTLIVISTCFKMKLHMHKCTVYSKQRKETTRRSWLGFFSIAFK